MTILKSLSMVVAGVVFIAPLLSNKAEAATMNQVNPTTLTGTALITFDDVTGGPSPGTNYDTIFESGGANFGERFVGQTLSSSSDNFDILSGTPAGSLTLQAGKTGQNLAVFQEGNYSNSLVGLSPVGSTPGVNDGYGEGSFAVLFDFDQSEFGFDFRTGDSGLATVNFFKRNGSLLETIVLSDLMENTAYGFRRDGGIKDIAGISVENTDAGGLGFDNLRSDVPGVPGVPNNPSPPTEIPFEFSPSLGILILGGWAAIGMLKTKVQKRKVLEVVSLKTNGQAESV